MAKPKLVEEPIGAASNDPTDGIPVKMFRAYRDPHIPPKPRNAFTMGDGPDQLRGTAVATRVGVLVKALYKDKGEDIQRTFLIPYANVELVEFK